MLMPGSHEANSRTAVSGVLARSTLLPAAGKPNVCPRGNRRFSGVAEICLVQSAGHRYPHPTNGGTEIQAQWCETLREQCRHDCRRKRPLIDPGRS